MNELFKGLIGAELTLLGVPNQALPPSVAAQPERRLPRIDPRGDAAAAGAIQPFDSSASQGTGVEFSESHYRIAAG
ncbi:hypothetical protein AKI39_20290 [Bordetella sp. H567]|uniref:hypothetical protein n=1 Tax=Bordetella sp. H567 TaxID=1697043 RepID=UPI00081C8F7D|nr:hypothetical protein [Bordetella sp. H567]AOB32571.1 hypothetical protein AKI39_20290 [Bordetella sp. H567]